MSKAFAIIVDGKVSNIALFESLENAQQEVGELATVVDITEVETHPEIDGAWDGERFHPAPVFEEPVVEPIEEPITE